METITEVIGAFRRSRALLLGILRLIVVFVPFPNLFTALGPVVELINNARFALDGLQHLQLLT
jgi:hypothetical protein